MPATFLKDALTKVLSLRNSFLSPVTKEDNGALSSGLRVENVMMDEEPEQTTSRELGCRAVKISVNIWCRYHRIPSIAFTCQEQTGNSV